MYKLWLSTQTLVPQPTLQTSAVLNKGKLAAADHNVDIQLQGATHQSQPTGRYVCYEYS